MKRSLVALCLLLLSLPVFAAGNPERKHSDNSIQHVLLISVDGMHSLDMVNYIAKHPKSAMAELSKVVNALAVMLGRIDERVANQRASIERLEDSRR